MKRLLNYIPTLIIVIAIGYLSLTTALPVSLPRFNIPYADKWMHFLMYMALCIAMMTDMQRDNIRFRLSAFITFVFAILYGGLIELLQSCFFSPRTGEWLDWIADAAGAFCGIFITFVLLKLCNRPNR